ncbi:hypothetical protein [Pseudomonas sp. Irchel s3h9]|uniref:hypothetical protein n=1 Tax=Pseudomonas sp. Irchel s3h9 TaxID=2009192 RepID=UPI002115A766|nr:hypothetical protein [Pseudomonas sp. Irchel s3h9]
MRDEKPPTLISRQPHAIGFHTNLTMFNTLTLSTGETKRTQQLLRRWVVSDLTTNGFNKSDHYSCEWVLQSHLIK